MSKPNVLFVVSANVGLTSRVGPRKDYSALIDALDATVIDYTSIQKSGAMRRLARVVGTAAAQAWMAFCRRNEFDAILTDGEHIGIPLAVLLKLVRARLAHVTIGHRLTASKKRPFFRWLKVHSHISRIAVHARAQHELALRGLEIPPEKLALLPYQVDTDFWRPQSLPEERLICSAGLEFRDYPTLMRAVDGLDVRVVIGAASHWSKRRNTAADVSQPRNVTVDSFDYMALRDLYARSAIVVVPLDDTDFQAGITTILEAMSMAKPVIVTHTHGQTDVVSDRRTVTRGDNPRARPESLLEPLARRMGVALEQTGFYVPPLDPGALRRAIAYLLEHPTDRERLGAAARRTVEQLMTVDQYAARLQELVNEACAERAVRTPTRSTRPEAALAATRGD